MDVSPDNPDDQLAFDNKYHLGFPLLADEGHGVADAYDVWGDGYNVSPEATPQNLLSTLGAG